MTQEWFEVLEKAGLSDNAGIMAFAEQCFKKDNELRVEIEGLLARIHALENPYKCYCGDLPGTIPCVCCREREAAKNEKVP